MKKFFTATNVVSCDMVKTILESNGVECTIRNEQGSAIAGVGLPIPGSPSLSFAWPEIWVRDEDYDEALKLVADFEKRDQSLTEDYGSPTKGSRFVPGFFFGLLIAATIFLLWSIHEKRFTGVKVSDNNGDGKPDAWYHYQRGVLTKVEEDKDGDERVDTWWLYTNGILSEGIKDADYNGKPDVTYFYSKGCLTKAEWRPNGTQILVKREIYQHTSLVKEWTDDNRDGKFDKVMEYDWMGNVIATRKL